MQDLKGGWLTSLTGFQDGDAISWQHRMIVRKVMGSAAVAWEQWRDCADYAAACTAGKATGLGWTSPSRVLLVMDPKGGVHGVGATGTLELTPGETGTTGMTAVMIGAGQRPNPMQCKVSPLSNRTGGPRRSRSPCGSVRPVPINRHGHIPRAVVRRKISATPTTLPCRPRYLR